MSGIIELSPLEAIADVERIRGLFDEGDFSATLAGEISEEFYGAIEENFAAESEATGAAWEELSPRYKAWKEKHYPGQPILVLTGRMKAAATGASGEAGTMFSAREAAWWIEDIPYAKSHMTGKKNMPARPFFDISDMAKLRIGNVVAEELAKRIG